MRLLPLKGDEPIGLIDGDYVTAQVDGKWYMTLTTEVRKNDDPVEAVDLDKPLSARQIAKMEILDDDDDEDEGIPFAATIRP